MKDESNFKYISDCTNPESLVLKPQES